MSETLQAPLARPLSYGYASGMLNLTGLFLFAVISAYWFGQTTDVQKDTSTWDEAIEAAAYAMAWLYHALWRPVESQRD